MANIVRILRSAVARKRPADGTRPVGEAFVNFADRQFGVVDPQQKPMDLLPITQHSAATTYQVGALVVRDGTLYACKTAVVAPEAFDPAKWIAVSVPNAADVITTAGGTFKGPVTLAGPPQQDLEPATKRWVEEHVAAGSGAPLPTNTDGPGKILLINPPAGSGMTLPAGGSWLVQRAQYGSAGGNFTFVHAFSILAGGTPLSAPAAGFAWVGWAWRIQ